MERLKSKTTLLVAVVLAAVLAMAGVGYALAAPNNSEENTGISTQAEDNPIYGLTVSEIMNKYPRASTTTLRVGIGKYPGIMTRGNVYCNIDILEGVSITDRGFEIDNSSNHPDNIEFVLLEEYGNEYNRTYNIYIINMEANPAENQSNIAFNFNFKATGIQSTGFNNYKEAFAALNN